ncbi:type III restriction protein res subunit, partial [Rhodococcus wratislaviensis IFP 2016]
FFFFKQKTAYELFHTIKGTMPAGKRREILNRLAHEAPDSGIPTACVVANARCLTEGVDIPTLDGVVFVDPRRSRIDVVQSVGRAIRRADNKTRGLVVIPVALSRDDDSETSLAGSAFSRVWDVLGALRDHDDALADELDALRTELGRRGTLDRGALSKIRLDLPTWAGPEFAEAIRLKMVEHTTSSFHHNLGLLQAFADENRHANVPNKYVVEGVTLGRWVSVQRGNKDTLPTDRRTQLESVQGWSWDARAAMWEEKLAALHAFVARMGHAIVPQGYEENGIKLGIWVNEQRTNHDRDKLTDERRAKLQAVQGWSWDPYEDAWNRGYEALVTYAAHTGHTRVPKVYDQGGVNLGSWVGEQRSNYRKGRLSDERRAKLEAIPSWSWDAIADSWNSRLAALQAFVVRESHARVPAEHDENGVPLGSWVRTQRKKREKLT